MMHVTCLLFIFALIITRTPAKPSLDFYGKSIEYDTRIPGLKPYFQPNELNSELNLEKEFQVWNGDEPASNIDEKPITVDNKFFKICEQFELILHTELEQKKIDCRTIEFVPKTAHPVIKRDVVEEEAASGDGAIENSKSEVPPEIVPDKEPTDDQQSNIATQDITEEKGVKQEIPVLQNQLSKQSIKTQEIEPKVEGSSENPNKASKDTNILICLFVAVGGVAIGAFAYNFIKKRRKNVAAHEQENVENGKTVVEKNVEELGEEDEMLPEREEKTESEEIDNKTAVRLEMKEKNDKV